MKVLLMALVLVSATLTQAATYDTGSGITIDSGTSSVVLKEDVNVVADDALIAKVTNYENISAALDEAMSQLRSEEKFQDLSDKELIDFIIESNK